MSTQRRLKSVDVFDEALMFFTEGDWIGLKAPKNADYHLHVGFTSKGLRVIKTSEHPKSHTIVLELTHQQLSRGLQNFFSRICRREIDPKDPKFKKWVVLIPKSTSPDSRIAKKLVTEKNRRMALTFVKFGKTDPTNMLRRLYYVLPMADVSGRQFKWGFA